MNKIAAYELLLTDHPLWEPSSKEASYYSASGPLFADIKGLMAKKIGRTAASKDPAAGAMTELRNYYSRGSGKSLRKRLKNIPGGASTRERLDLDDMLKGYESTLKRMAGEGS